MQQNQPAHKTGCI